MSNPVSPIYIALHILQNKRHTNGYQSLQARVSKLITRWPSDPVRPASVSVQSYLQSRLSQPAKGQQPLSEPSVNALESLLSNKYAQTYPVPRKLRYPASNPSHYDDVVREFDEAPSRNWWGRLKIRLAGLFRFQ